MNKVSFYTLGCKLNFAETSSIVRLFTEKGFTKVEINDTPDIFVINTCSVTDNADKKCQKLVKDFLKISPHAYIIITGCYAQLKPKEISMIPGVDAVVGSNEKFRILELISSFTKNERAVIHVGEILKNRVFEHAHSENDRTRTFLKVQDGCNYYCSFCTIPLARGASRSARPDEIVDKAKSLASRGVKEIVLTGVNIGDYGTIDGKRTSSFYDLIRLLDEIEGDTRFRISSIEPNLLDSRIIEFVASSRKFVPHFHIPLQSGNSEILKAMRRKYPRELYQDRVSNIKSLMPECCIGVDVIVGFPGESHQHFLDTYRFLNDLDVSYLHVFPYSERPNTRAISMKGRVMNIDRIERAKMLRILSEKKRRSFYDKHLNKEYTVLFEKEKAHDKMYGFTENYIKIEARYCEEMVNKFHKVTLKDFLPSGNIEAEII